MKSDLYNTYANSTCSEIPFDYLKQFILTFLVGASQDMGQEFDRETTPGRIYDIISTHYHHLPLSLIASAFKRGALGQYGTGRLVPRTIFGWLGEINQYFITCHEKRDQSQDNKHKFDGLEKYPMGKAIAKKNDWLISGVITSEEYDRIPLKEVAEIIGAGHEPNLEHFGITVK